MIEKASCSVHAIVLAAGGSSRFGSPKQCALLDGESLIQRAIAAAHATVDQAFHVVLGAHATYIASTLELQANQLVINPKWAEGIASSIRVAMGVVPASSAAVMILLADQPHITGASLGRLVTAWHGAPECIVASRFGSVTGAPCLFPRLHFDELATLQGDQGARRLLQRHSARVVTVDHPEAAIDIDTPQQLAAQQAPT